MPTPIVTLFRPTGPEELELVKRANFKRWPARLPDQPIFYAVTNAAYARQIATQWNLPASGKAYITRFKVRKSFIDRYQLHQVGSSIHTEWWIPAEDLEQLNDNIIGQIELLEQYQATAK